MTVIMFIAVVEAMLIGLLVSDKLGLIKDTKVDNNPNDNKRDADSTKSPSGQVKQSGCNKYGHNENDHTTTNNIGKPFIRFTLLRHLIRIIGRQSTKCK